VLQSLLNALLYGETHLQDGTRKDRGLLALLDEFPQLGRLDFIEQHLAVCAGYGIRAVLVCQDEDQIRAAYGQHQSITANCRTICCIPGFSHESLDTVTRWGGERIQVTSSKQRQVGVFRAPSLGETETRTPVLNPRELIRRGQKEVLVFTAGCDPTWLRKVRYDKEREFKRMFDPADQLAIGRAPAPKPRPVEGNITPGAVELDLQEMLR
jgi:type IV secretion system protein VirD4